MYLGPVSMLSARTNRVPTCLLTVAELVSQRQCNTSVGRENQFFETQKGERILEGVIKPEVEALNQTLRCKTSLREALPAKAATDLVEPGVAWTPA
jgi:hypothetical protein